MYLRYERGGKREMKGNFKDFGLDTRRMKLPAVEMEQIDKREIRIWVGFFLLFIFFK